MEKWDAQGHDREHNGDIHRELQGFIDYRAIVIALPQKIRVWFYSPPAFWANIAAAINPKIPACIVISAPAWDFSGRLLHGERSCTYSTQ